MGFSSQAGHLLMRTQTAKGTLAPDLGTAGVAMKIKSGTLGPSRELMIPDAEIGGGRDIVDAYLGAVAFSGDIEFYTRLESFATLAAAALGTSASATATGVNTHTITPSDAAQLPFLSLEEQVGNGLEVFTYQDAVVNTLHLESEANGFLSGTAGLIAIRQEAGATPTVTPEWDNSPMIVGTNCTVTYNSVTVAAKSFSLDINNNFEDDDYRLGGFYLGDLTPKRREVTAQISVRHQDSNMWRQAVYGLSSATSAGGLATKAPLVITMSTYEDIPGSTPLTKSSLELTIPSAILKPFAFSPSGDDVLENDVEIQAVRPDPGTPIATLVIKNAKADIA